MDKKRSRHHRRKRKYSSSSSSKSRPSSSVSIQVSRSDVSSSSEKVAKYRPKNHDNTVLLVENLPEDIEKQQLEQVFNEAAIEANVIPHEDISILKAFGQAYIKYCTIDYARKVLIYIKGHIQIGAHSLSVDFYDDTSGRPRRNRKELKNSLINQPPTSYDWICDKCSYENFAKRHKCNKCLNPRNSNCKILSVLMAPPSGFADDSSQNTSLMIKAKAIADATESEILDIFSSIASVKDIRLVKNKQPKDPRMKEQKDFAFVEFYSVEDTENVFRYVTQNEVRLRGDQLIIQYSRSNRSSRFEDALHQKYGFFPGQFQPPSQFQPPAQFYPPQQAPDPNLRPIMNPQNPQQQQGNPMNQQIPNQIQQVYGINPNIIIPPIPTSYAPEIIIQTIEPTKSEMQILQPVVSAPYQTAQLASERILAKQLPPKPLMQAQLPKVPQLVRPPMQPKPIKKQEPIIVQQQVQEPEIEQEEEEEEEEVKPEEPLPIQKPKIEKKLTEAEIRKKAEQDLKKWEKQQLIKKQNEIKTDKVVMKSVVNIQQDQKLIFYICPVCRRKFLNEEILLYHTMYSDMHRENLRRMNIDQYQL